MVGSCLVAFRNSCPVFAVSLHTPLSQLSTSVCIYVHRGSLIQHWLWRGHIVWVSSVVLIVCVITCPNLLFWLACASTKAISAHTQMHMPHTHKHTLRPYM